MTKMQARPDSSGEAATKTVATALKSRVNPAVLVTASGRADATAENPGTSRAISSETCAGTASAIAGR